MELPTAFERKWRSLNQANRKQASDFIDFLLCGGRLIATAQVVLEPNTLIGYANSQIIVGRTGNGFNINHVSFFSLTQTNRL